MRYLTLDEQLEISTKLYVAMTRDQWREEWTDKTARSIRKLWMDSWKKAPSDQGRRNMFHNMLLAASGYSAETIASTS